MQSFGSYDGNFPTRCTFRSHHDSESGGSNSTSSDVNYSSNDHESDNEYLVATGATVTGPSIYFASAESCSNDVGPDSPKKTYDYNSWESFSASLETIMNQKSNILKESERPRQTKNKSKSVEFPIIKQTKSPTPQYTNNPMYQDPNVIQQQQACNFQGFSNSPPGQPFGTATPVVSPVSSNYSHPIFPSATDDAVELAMLRVSNEFAIEPKSEIREVISQVDQGMEDYCAQGDRANSFNVKDKKVDDLKRRTCTLSGQLLENNPPKKEEAQSLAQSKSDKAVNESSMLHFHEDPDSPGICCNADPFVAELKDKGLSMWHCPPKNIINPTLGALRDFSMLKDGDKVLVCLSGGKDSLSLLHTMKQMQYVMAKEGIAFTFGAVTVDPKHSGYNPKPLIPYLKALGVPYFYEEQGMMSTTVEKEPNRFMTNIICFNRIKRGLFYATALKNGYNVLALAQNLDDMAESFLTSVFQNGLMRTMNVAYTVKDGDLRVIRPFVNVREKALQDFADSRGLPVIPENFEEPAERHRIKQLLAQQEILFPKIYLGLRSAMQHLMTFDHTGLEAQGKYKNVNVITTDTFEDDE